MVLQKGRSTMAPGQRTTTHDDQTPTTPTSERRPMRATQCTTGDERSAGGRFPHDPLTSSDLQTNIRKTLNCNHAPTRAAKQASTRETFPCSDAEANRKRMAHVRTDAAQTRRYGEAPRPTGPANRGATTNRQCGRACAAATPSPTQERVATAHARAAGQCSL